jgi:hypothetical protein
VLVRSSRQEPSIPLRALHGRCPPETDASQVIGGTIVLTSNVRSV